MSMYRRYQPTGGFVGRESGRGTGAGQGSPDKREQRTENHSLQPKPQPQKQRQQGEEWGQKQRRQGQNMVQKPSHPPMCQRNATEKREKKRVQGNAKEILYGLIPSSVYNPDTKKVFGLLEIEDLLLLALILVLAEDTEENQGMLILALAYLLLGDYIDLPI